MRVLRWLIGIMGVVIVLYIGMFGVLLILWSDNAPTQTTQPPKKVVEKPAVKDESPLASWSSTELAAQLCLIGVSSDDELAITDAVAKGSGALSFIGPPPANLTKVLDAVTTFAHNDIKPFFASDEEGGSGSSLIEGFPSAQQMGKMSTGEIADISKEYGIKTSDAGINMVFAPVCDIEEPGGVIGMQGRSFSSDPNVVATDTEAWAQGMSNASQISVIKHWPGIGSLQRISWNMEVPALSELEKREMIPFNAAFKNGADVVMVEHVFSEGLTSGDSRPASMSPKALEYLRKQAGDKTLIITDSLRMPAASKALGISQLDAAVLALDAGCDMAMITIVDANEAINSVASAIDSGVLSRPQAEKKVMRILALKAANGLAPKSYK